MARWIMRVLRVAAPFALAAAWSISTDAQPAPSAPAAPASAAPSATQPQWPEDPPDGAAPAATAAPAEPAPAPTTAPPSTAAPAAPAPPAQAPPPPPPEDRWWEQMPPRESSTSRIPFIATGSALAGVGALVLMAAGITWLVAAGESTTLDDECPHKICYEDSRGGDALERARDAENAADVMVAVAVPAIGTGIILLMVGGGLRDDAPRVGVAPMVVTGGTGLAVEATF